MCTAASNCAVGCRESSFPFSTSTVVMAFQPDGAPCGTKGLDYYLRGVQHRCMRGLCTVGCLLWLLFFSDCSLSLQMFLSLLVVSIRPECEVTLLHRSSNSSTWISIKIWVGFISLRYSFPWIDKIFCYFSKQRVLAVITGPWTEVAMLSSKMCAVFAAEITLRALMESWTLQCPQVTSISRMKVWMWCG